MPRASGYDPWTPDRITRVSIDAPTIEPAAGPNSPQPHMTPAAPQTLPSAAPLKPKRSFMDRLDIFISRLTSRSNFWQRVCSLFWLPYAFKSGIRIKRVDENAFAAELPFRRFNRNFYNAMAGAALLGNSEIAGGMYVFAHCGGDYVVVCKTLDYKFLRPCFGPAVYKITPREDLKTLLATAAEFNVTLDMEIVQQSLIPEPIRPGAEAVLPRAVGERVAAKEKRVGHCTAVFHVTPKAHQVSKGRRIR